MIVGVYKGSEIITAAFRISLSKRLLVLVMEVVLKVLPLLTVQFLQK